MGNTAHNVISFSENWNGKLNTRCYTTFRFHNPSRFIVGKQYDVFFKVDYLHTVELLAVYPVWLDKVTEYATRLDTGYNVEEFKKLVLTMYKKVPNAATKRFAFHLLQVVGTQPISTHL